ncbi:hypothetical protein [Intrasporangium sp. YIM S08009]|uniref:hypothetical protein n=1 Tax=Intrasporangium zincisolvens TaxID=3080018 RepID=UPI002B056007|nr:hypothetical protein [Intrasporangium sp. YIM S08009]
MGRVVVSRWRPVVGAVLGAFLTASVAGCTSADPGLRASTRPASGAVVAPGVTFTPVDPGPAPTITVPPRRAGEVARVVVTRNGPGKAFRNVPGQAAAAGRTYTVEVACAAGRPAADTADTAGTTYAIYDAAPGTWGHGEPLYSRPFACDGTVQRTVDLGLPAGPVQIDVRGLPADAVAAYAVIRPE